MRLLLAKPRGFCAGVQRAIDTVKKALELWGAPIYVKHEIVHNRHVVEELKAMGAVFIEDLELVPRGSRLIYSAHGVPPSIRELAKQRELFEIDATCALVTKVHSAAVRFVEKGYRVILIGHRNHVETIGTVGEAPHAISVVESAEEANRIEFDADQKLAYLTQTTLSLDDVQEIAQVLKRRFPSIETMPSSSICYATSNRQQALGHMALRADLALVVGDPKSSNSNRLCEVARHRGMSAHLVNGPSDIDPAWFDRVETIAMTAGASTPERIVQDCVRRLQDLTGCTVEEVNYVEENVFFQLPKQVLVRSQL